MSLAGGCHGSRDSVSSQCFRDCVPRAAMETAVTGPAGVPCLQARQTAPAPRCHRNQGGLVTLPAAGPHFLCLEMRPLCPLGADFAKDVGSPTPLSV